VTDAALFREWADGDAKAGARLFERHFPTIERFFRHKLVGADLADDLVQQTFLGVLEARARFRGEASFRTFLFAVARNVLGKYLRTKSRDARRFDPSLHSVADLGPSPSTALAVAEASQLLLDALRSLPVDSQTVLELFYWENMRGAEIAAVLEVPLGTAKTRLRTARLQLAARLRALKLAVSPARHGDLDGWVRRLRADDAASLDPPT
jgi:RNA polymerase sigma-70 factor (ECF subfamily)